MDVIVGLYLILLALSIPVKGADFLPYVSLWNKFAPQDLFLILIWLPYSAFLLGYLLVRLLPTLNGSDFAEVFALSAGVSFGLVTILGFLSNFNPAIAKLLAVGTGAILILFKVRMTSSKIIQRTAEENGSIETEGWSPAKDAGIFLALAAICVSVLGVAYLYSVQQYLIPGDQWRFVQVGGSLLVGEKSVLFPQNQTAAYPVLGGYTLLGYSQLMSSPVANTLLFLSVLTPLFIPLASYSLSEELWPAKGRAKLFKLFLFLFGGGLGGLVLFTNALGSGDWWTVSYFTQDMYFSFKLVNSIDMNARTLGFLLAVTALLLIVKLMRHQMRRLESGALCVMTALLIALSFLVHLEDFFVVVLPFSIVFLLLRRRRTDRITFAGIFIAAISFVLLFDLKTGEYTLFLLLAKLQLLQQTRQDLLPLFLVGVLVAIFLVLLGSRLKRLFTETYSSALRKFVYAISFGSWLFALGVWFAAYTNGALAHPLLYDFGTGYPIFLYATSLGLIWPLALLGLGRLDMKNGNAVFILWWGLLLVALSALVDGSRVSVVVFIPAITLATLGFSEVERAILSHRKTLVKNRPKVVFFVISSCLIAGTASSWAISIWEFSGWPPSMKPISSSFVDAVSVATRLIPPNSTTLFEDQDHAEFAANVGRIVPTSPPYNSFSSDYANLTNLWTSIMNSPDFARVLRGLSEAKVSYAILPKAASGSQNGILPFIIDTSQTLYKNTDYNVVKLEGFGNLPKGLVLALPITYSLQGFYNTSLIGLDTTRFLKQVAQIASENYGYHLGWTANFSAATYEQISTDGNSLFPHTVMSNGTFSSVLVPQSNGENFYSITFKVPLLNLSRFSFFHVGMVLNDTTLATVEAVVFKGTGSVYPLVGGYAFPIIIEKSTNRLDQLFMLPIEFSNYSGPVTLSIVFRTDAFAHYRITIYQAGFIGP